MPFTVLGFRITLPFCFFVLWIIASVPPNHLNHLLLLVDPDIPFPWPFVHSFSSTYLCSLKNPTRGRTTHKPPPPTVVLSPEAGVASFSFVSVAYRQPSPQFPPGVKASLVKGCLSAGQRDMLLAWTSQVSLLLSALPPRHSQFLKTLWVRLGASRNIRDWKKSKKAHDIHIFNQFIEKPSFPLMPVTKCKIYDLVSNSLHAFLSKCKNFLIPFHLYYPLSFSLPPSKIIPPLVLSFSFCVVDFGVDICRFAIFLHLYM